MGVETYADDKLYAYTLATRVRDSGKDFDLTAGNDGLEDIWSDGSTMWVANEFDDKLYAYVLATGARDAGKDIDLASGNDAPFGLWSDGTTMWVADNTDDKLYAYTLATGVRDSDKDFDLTAGNNDPLGLWSDGTTMWVSDRDDEKLYAYALATGARDSRWDVDTLAAAGNTSAAGLWSDGTTMWVADWVDDKLYAYYLPLYEALTAGVRGQHRADDGHGDGGAAQPALGEPGCLPALQRRRHDLVHPGDGDDHGNVRGVQSERTCAQRGVRPAGVLRQHVRGRYRGRGRLHQPAGAERHRHPVGGRER